MARFGLATDLRVAVLVAAICAGVLIAGLTELLSLFGALTAGELVVAWVAALAAAGVLVMRSRILRGWRPIGRLPLPPRGLDLAMAAWIAVVVVLSGMLALLAVPITYDSMTYHLARVVHWAQNGSVDFYPTHIIRQLYQPPWAEYALLHLFLVGRGDRLVNLVQWASMAATLVGVTVIARQLGAGRRGSS